MMGRSPEERLPPETKTISSKGTFGMTGAIELHHKRMLQLCLARAEDSPDPSTKLGALIGKPGGTILGTGCNAFPPGFDPTPARLTDRQAKLDFIVHAEMAAILDCARLGFSTNGTILYFAARDAYGHVWGGTPCVRCCAELITAGVRHIISPPSHFMPDRWFESTEKGRMMLFEAGVTCEIVEL